MTEFLYGLPEAEVMYRDPAEVWEAEIEPYTEDGEAGPWVIERWTVADPIKHLPSVARVIDWLGDEVADAPIDETCLEDYCDAIEATGEHLARCLQLIASKVTYRMADEKVGEHTLFLDDRPTPLLDGEPMYRKTQA